MFSTHSAADGAMARIRLPGGLLRPDQLLLLSAAADTHADGHLELTARANLQIRGIRDVEAVADAVVAAGLAPSETHEKARNIEVSPLTGRIGGVTDVRPLADDLDRALRADDSLAELSGRFLFGLDDGRGDILAQRPDACAVAFSTDDGAVGALIAVDGAIIGEVDHLDAVPAALLDVARETTGNGEIWRVRDLGDVDRAELLGRIGDRLQPASTTELTPLPDPSPLVGWFEQDEGQILLGAVVELARIPARLAEFLAAIDTPIIITPHREILICDLAEGVADTVVRVLAPMGLILDANSPWAAVSCCVGAPGCGNALAPVRADLVERVADDDPVTEREHWVGCSRGCGAPQGAHLRVEATDEGYRTEPRGIDPDGVGPDRADT
ncbi:precorrin-3B synthase [Gordonia soli NBRC 108243]|uniref:Precorrin-3B synthase n=2 Tax=Gordonia soli TaxID=320799 RepID=M0QPD8_9ACTN|nr:precorrin-3B synthase [Gordonia soli NBRC 108243]